jgi:hypothetical protein
MIETSFGYINEGYCEEASRESCRVISYVTCNNKAKYKITLDNGRVINVCGTHLRQYYKCDLYDKPIKGKFLKMVTKVEEIKTGKVIYENIYPTGSTH